MLDLMVMSTVERSAALIRVLLSKVGSGVSSISVIIFVVDGAMSTSGSVRSPMTRIGDFRSGTDFGTIRLI